MTDQETIDRINVVDLRPGDVLVFRMREHITAEQRDYLHAMLSRKLPGIKCLICTAVEAIDVVRAHE
jgi:hypothetical protein